MTEEWQATSKSVSGEPREVTRSTSSSPEDAESPAGAAIAAQLVPISLPSEPVFYLPSFACGPFRQAEILSNVRQFGIVIDSLGDEEAQELEPIDHDLAIILSQDCDLEQDFKRRESARSNGGVIDRRDDKFLPCVLLCEVATWKSIDDAIRHQGSTIRERFKKNLEERYQYLREVGAQDDLRGVGLEAMGVDFRRYFAVPTAELYAQLLHGCIRRCRLAPQYLEHFSRRFANHISRVGLPKNHHD